ncbi:SAM-dependent methyltransferase [Geobacillus subterraneus]|uniref:SAM-dependent methyltransferase n=2 Tax=Geobacillus TaxID=129337 RepID=A0ABM6AFN5_9BACL|nr:MULTISPECIES: tRNA (adenine(22)-N(1))-methyltransferase TrmK [Geobacillus]AMX85205.1 SAM-dependent methyltransferase [Geobacillus subterraneus]KZS26339.1 SAM-dependent methyltransferase [Geobacillus subterraneus]QIZ69085.1 tRNA (adenine-N(1))-methyltransferase [Geobacillus subterraneus]WPZ20122.1 tRNA (adenine(22)-N(1))-methyltransferase TrmK [Geobacillus subterraneus]
MNEFHLSKRLETVASFIPKGAVLADIGSDHAYLPCYACLRGYAAKAIAGEVADGPLRSARQQVEKAGLSHLISVRKGDGLAVIAPGEADCITIAGMGGSLIARILGDGEDKLAGVRRLILQPNIGAELVRRWLLDHGWELVAERILKEDGQIYEVLVAERGDARRPYRHLEAELLLGPFLRQENSEVFREKWQRELRHWKRIIADLAEKGESEAAQEKKRELEKKVQLVEEALP